MLKYIDACSGIGGCHLGVQDAVRHSECVGAIETDKYAKTVYKQNFPKTNIFNDITKINPLELPHHDLFISGFPCQPFSNCGKQLGFADIRGSIFNNIVEILKVKKPKYILLENVPNILKHNNKRTINLIISYLNDANYGVDTYTFNSYDFGLAQYRKRCYIVGKFNGKPNTIVPPNIKKCSVKDILEEDVSEKYFLFLFKHFKSIQLQPTYISLSNKIYNKPKRVGIVNKGRQGERIYSIYGPSVTLIAHGGGLAGKTGIYYIGRRLRKLTPRECARLQGFPEKFILSTSDAQSYKQFGNAASVDVISSIVGQMV